MISEGEKIDVPYRQLVGSYLAVFTRPDLAFTASQLSKYLDSPIQHHWPAGKRVLRYLLGTTNIGIICGSDKLNNNNKLVDYSDLDYGACVDTRRSISGAVISLKQ